MKTLIVCISLLLCFCSKGQSLALVDSINKIIGPEYKIERDTEPPYNLHNTLDEIDLDGDGINEIITAPTSTDEEQGSRKIFVLARKNNTLIIIDSSAAYEIDGRGPQVQTSGLQLTISRSFSHGASSSTYHFNKLLKCYLLVSANYRFSEKNTPDDKHILDVGEDYDVKTEMLALNATISSYKDESTDGEKKKIIHKPLQPGSALRLSKIKDPVDAIDVFLFDGPVYNELTKF